MIISFKDEATEDIFNGRSTRAARKACPSGLHRITGRKLEMVDSAITVDELRVPPGNRLEKLSGDREGQYSIRVNDQYRVCFSWGDSGPEEVEVVDYH